MPLFVWSPSWDNGVINKPWGNIAWRTCGVHHLLAVSLLWWVLMKHPGVRWWDRLVSLSWPGNTELEATPNVWMPCELRPMNHACPKHCFSWNTSQSTLLTQKMPKPWGHLRSSNSYNFWRKNDTRMFHQVCVFFSSGLKTEIQKVTCSIVKPQRDGVSFLVVRESRIVQTSKKNLLHRHSSCWLDDFRNESIFVVFFEILKVVFWPKHFLNPFYLNNKKQVNNCYSETNRVLNSDGWRWDDQVSAINVTRFSHQGANSWYVRYPNPVQFIHNEKAVLWSTKYEEEKLFNCWTFLWQTIDSDRSRIQSFCVFRLPCGLYVCRQLGVVHCIVVLQKKISVSLSSKNKTNFHGPFRFMRDETTSVSQI